MISVIVPIYNKEKYLKRCIESILNQTHKDLEVLLINDGSTDGSLNICKNYAKKDPRVRIISKENSGVSSTRNLGIENCKGAYYAFIDPDDYIDINYFQKLQNCIKKYDADIVYCFAIDLQEEYGKTVTYSKNTGKCMLWDTSKYDWCSPVAHKVVWGALYCKEKFEKIRFDDDITIAEDTLYFARCVKKGTQIVCLDEALYYYVKNSDSLTNDSYSDKNKSELIAWDRICSLFEGNKIVFGTAKSEYAQTCKKIVQKHCHDINFTKLDKKIIGKIYKNNAPYLLRYSLEKRKLGLSIKTLFSIIFWNLWVKSKEKK